MILFWRRYFYEPPIPANAVRSSIVVNCNVILYYTRYTLWILCGLGGRQIEDFSSIIIENPIAFTRTVTSICTRFDDNAPMRRNRFFTKESSHGLMLSIKKLNRINFSLVTFLISTIIVTRSIIVSHLLNLFLNNQPFYRLYWFLLNMYFERMYNWYFNSLPQLEKKNVLQIISIFIPY